MLDVFHRGVGWFIAKHFLEFKFKFLPQPYVRTIRAARGRRKASENLDALFPDQRMTLVTDIDKIRYVSLRTLRILYHIGQKHGFEFQLAYGSLLGAIRHGGFIPWDDDLDVFMTEADFTKFLAVVHELPDSLELSYFRHEFWKLMDRYSDVTGGRWGGICVDIFIIKPDPKEQGHRFLNVHKFRYVTIPDKALFPLSSVEFAGSDVVLPVPAEPAFILEMIYGKWRELPPEDQRVFPHLSEDPKIRSLAEDALHPHPFRTGLPD